MDPQLYQLLGSERFRRIRADLLRLYPGGNVSVIALTAALKKYGLTPQEERQVISALIGDSSVTGQGASLVGEGPGIPFRPYQAPTLAGGINLEGNPNNIGKKHWAQRGQDLLAARKLVRAAGVDPLKASSLTLFRLLEQSIGGSRSYLEELVREIRSVDPVSVSDPGTSPLGQVNEKGEVIYRTQTSGGSSLQGEKPDNLLKGLSKKPPTPIEESLAAYEEFRKLAKEGKRTSYRMQPVSQTAPETNQSDWAEYRMTEGRYAGMKLGEIPDAYWHKYLANRNPRRALPWHVKQYLENRSGMLLGGSRQLPSIDPATGQVTRQESGRNDYLGHESTRFSDQDIFSPMDLGGRLEPMSEGFGVSDTFDRPPIVQVDWRTGRKFESPDWGRRKYAYRRVKQYDPEYYESKERGDLNQVIYGRRNAKPRQMPTWFWKKFLRDNPYFAAIFETQDQEKEYQIPLQKKMKWYKDKYTGERRRIWTGQYEHPLAPQMMMARKMAGELWAEQYEMLDLDRWRQKEMTANKWEYMRAGVAGSMAFRDEEIEPYEGPAPLLASGERAYKRPEEYTKEEIAELEEIVEQQRMFGGRGGYDPREGQLKEISGGGNPYGQGWIRELYDAGQQGRQVLDAKAQEILETLQDADEDVMDQFQEIYTSMLLRNQNQGLQRQP